MATRDGITKYFYTSLNDDPCGHAHRTFDQAEKCAAKTIRAAKRGQKFYNSDYAKKCSVKDAEIFVKSRLVSR